MEYLLENRTTETWTNLDDDTKLYLWSLSDLAGCSRAGLSLRLDHTQKACSR